MTYADAIANPEALADSIRELKELFSRAASLSENEVGLANLYLGQLRSLLKLKETQAASCTVVGWQSAGKSTLLNTMVGANVLLYSQDRATRSPCLVNAIKTEEGPGLARAGEKRALIGYREPLAGSEASVDRNSPPWMSELAVKEKVKENNDRIERDLPGGMSKEPLYMRVESPDIVYTSSFCDTPGIFFGPTGSADNPEQEEKAMEVVKGVITERAKLPNDFLFVVQVRRLVVQQARTVNAYTIDIYYSV